MLAVGLEGAPFVADAHVADALLLVRDGTLYLVEPEAVALERLPSVDPSRRLFAVDWSSGTPLTDDGAVLAAAFDRGAAATAAELLGITARLIDMSVEYARERRQFGRPIGAFQAVKHLLADALVRSAFAAPVVYRAAVTIAEAGPDRARDASMAKLRASEAALSAAAAALQIHGAIGYTAEHDLSLWLLRARALSSAWGDMSLHRARVADAVLGG
jgi:alkylation response protein AidB-like acyl-CoA dehydrogenase